MAGPNLNFGAYTATERIISLCDCSDSIRIPLQNAVEKHCKGEKSRCNTADGCSILSAKIAKINACILARTIINTKCFKGGDKGHKTAVENAIKAVLS